MIMVALWCRHSAWKFYPVLLIHEDFVMEQIRNVNPGRRYVAEDVAKYIRAQLELKIDLKPSDIAFVSADTCHEADRGSIAILETLGTGQSACVPGGIVPVESRYVMCLMHKTNLAMKHTLGLKDTKDANDDSYAAPSLPSSAPDFVSQGLDVIHHIHRTNAASLDKRFNIFISNTRYGTNVFALEKLYERRAFFREEARRIHPKAVEGLRGWTDQTWEQLGCFLRMMGPAMQYLAITQTSAPTAAFNVEDAARLHVTYRESSCTQPIAHEPLSTLRNRLRDNFKKYVLDIVNITDWIAMVIHPLRTCFDKDIIAEGFGKDAASALRKNVREA